MNRRDFLKAIGVSALAVAVPAQFISQISIGESIEISKPNVDLAELEYGNSLMIHDLTPKSIEKSIKIIVKDVKRTLPVGSRYEIRAKYGMDYGRLNAICWYSNNQMQKKSWSIWLNTVNPELDVASGFLRVGQMVV